MGTALGPALSRHTHTQCGCVGTHCHCPLGPVCGHSQRVPWIGPQVKMGGCISGACEPVHLRLSTVRDTAPPCTTPHLGSPQSSVSPEAELSQSLTTVTHLNPMCAQSMADARRPPPTSARGLQSVKPGGSIAVQHPHGQAGEPRAGAGASAAAAWAGTGGWLVVRYRWWSNCTFCT